MSALNVMGLTEGLKGGDGVKWMHHLSFPKPILVVASHTYRITDKCGFGVDRFPDRVANGEG